MTALVIAGLAIILTAGSAPMTALADGFGWGSPAADSSATQFVGDGFGWGAPPVNPAEVR
ncbi:hypothetical protein ACTFTM_08590 [Micromonospora sp. RB23]